jgi:hypothetical protein
MSYYYAKRTNNTNARISATVEKKFCNTCFKAGKDASIYNSHYAKSVPGANGIVVCPTILAASCNYCGQSGHWANEKYCSQMRADLKHNNQAFEMVIDTRSRPKDTRQTVKQTYSSSRHTNRNVFSLLQNCDSENEAEDDENHVFEEKEKKRQKRGEKIPTPVDIVVEKPLPTAGISWASIVSTTPSTASSASASAKGEENKKKFGYQSGDRILLTHAQREAINILSEKRRAGTYSWADVYSDDDDDCDEDRTDNSAW